VGLGEASCSILCHAVRGSGKQCDAVAVMVILANEALGGLWHVVVQWEPIMPMWIQLPRQNVQVLWLMLKWRAVPCCAVLCYAGCRRRRCTGNRCSETWTG
jgi:hypothetical protein